MTRGRLLHFQCFVGERPSGEWKGIIHDNLHAHIIGRKRLGPIAINAGQYPQDSVRKIRFGYKITRKL
jgi:hypothetical protein